MYITVLRSCPEAGPGPACFRIILNASRSLKDQFFSPCIRFETFKPVERNFSMSNKFKRELEAKLAQAPESARKNTRFRSGSTRLSKKLAAKGGFYDELEAFLKEVTAAKKKAKGSKDDQISLSQIEACVIDGKKKYLKFKTKSNRPK